ILLKQGYKNQKHGYHCRRDTTQETIMGWGTKLRGTGKTERTVQGAVPKGTNRIVTSGKPKVAQSKTDYSKGERSPYWDWTEDHGGFDPISPDHIQEGSQPWDVMPMSDHVEGLWYSFEEIYLSLKGKQKEAADLLLSGQTNQVVMAMQLSMKPQGITKVLKALRKKIAKNANR